MESRDLTKSQKLIMRCVWEYEGDGDISYSELLRVLREDFGHDYKLVTLVTFLRQMAEKGYLTTYRRGKSAFVKPLVQEKDYIAEMASDTINFWFGGKIAGLIQSVADKGKLSQEDIDEIRAFIGQTE